ncbi:MAG: hypothetical protein ABI481_07825 [Pyrinomonadaceae bacterium]
MKWLEYLPDHWQENANEYIGRPESTYREISAADLINDMRLKFEDRSTAHFRYAFYLADFAAKEVGVFTEDCGYGYSLSRLNTSR